MDEEAAFVAALLADPDDGTVLLAYADWLQEHNDPRAAYLRLLDAEGPDHRLVIELRGRLDFNWVQLVASRGFAVGSLVRLADRTAGVVVSINEKRTAAVVEWATGGRYPQPFTALRLLGSPEAGSPSLQFRRVKPRRHPPRPHHEHHPDDED